MNESENWLGIPFRDPSDYDEEVVSIFDKVNNWISDVWKDDRVGEYMTWNWKAKLISEQAEKFISLGLASLIIYQLLK